MPVRRLATLIWFVPMGLEGRRLGELASRLKQEPPRLPEVRVWVSAAQRSPADLPRR
jgi:hypothetical protein